MMWGEVAGGLVGARGVVDTLPSQQLPIQGSHLQGEVVDLIELLGMGALSPLHTTVELGGAGWEHEEPDTLLPAGFLETRLELRAPVHPDGVYWERHPVQYSIQESRGRVRGSPGVGLHHVPAGDHVSGGEVLQHHAGEWPHVQSVHLDQVPGFLYTIPFGLAYRVGTTPQPLRVEMVLRRGSLSTPRAFKELSIRPTIEVDTCQPRSRIITTSLSFPQRGYCSLRCRTAKANSRDQVGLRSRLGLWLLSSKLLRSLELYRPFHR